MKTTRTPNVLFLFSDQHNARCLSVEGHPDVQTPHLDALAAGGVRYTNAYTNNPICTPSRMSFLSSLYPSTHGYYGLYGHEPVAPMTNMFSHFRRLGYRTGALGKLHTPRYWIEPDCQYVYDEFLDHPKYLEAAGLYARNDNRGFTGNRDGHPSELPLEHSCERVLAGQALRFLENGGEPKDRGDPDAPWFAWVSFSRPHQPYTASEPFASMYDPQRITIPPVAESEKADVRERRTKLGDRELRLQLAQYLGLVSQVDDSIGRILHAIDERGELENTIIVYSSDHGDFAGEHGLIEKRGGISYRAITRIPLIVSTPESRASGGGRTSDRVVEAVDLFPTLCDLARVPTPNTVQGQSFAGDGPERSSALTENAYRKSIATSRWRYIANLAGEEPDELYDLENDPWELVNLAQDPAHLTTVATLQRELLDRLARARRPVTTNNGGWHDHRYDDDGRIDLASCGPTTPYW